LADSNFWNDLAEQFESIDDPFGYVRANWRDDFDNGRPLWRIETPVSDPKHALLAKCESFVRRGGKQLDPSRDSLVAWCEELRKRKINIDRSGTTLLTSNSGRQLYVSHGTIVKLVEASCALCRRLESEALETERIASEEEKKKNDPGNWPEIVRQYELFKSIKNLITGPQEEVPEEVLRNLIAQQDNTRPEDVTFERLRVEAGKLMRHYAALRVTLLADETSAAPALEAGALRSVDLTISREERLQALISAEDVAIADVCRTARVYKANMQQWRREELSDDSAMSLRIEDVLNGKTPVKRRGKKKG
jgi:hypothetical protein